MRLSCILLSLTTTILSAQSIVPLPKISGPIPETATSKIFGRAASNMVPTDLAAKGYVEEEFLISGMANVYDWAADGSISVKGANNPYTTRIVVRRPADPDKFSGTVVVEIPNIARRYDWPMMWGYIGEHILDEGHAWVMIGMPASVASMKKVDAVRYGSLGFNNTSKACPGESEDGMRYDLFSQVSAALRSKQAGMPMVSLNVARVFLTTQDTGIITYVNAIHPNVRLEGNKPVFDGYMIKVLNAPGAINSCTRAPGDGDPRRKLKAIDVPTIAVLAQGEVEAMAWSRLPDSDSTFGKHRRYEVALASHIDMNAYDGMPSFAEQTAAGNAQGTPQWPFNARCTPEIQFQTEPLLGYIFDTALWHLDRWVKDGIAPPKAERMVIGGDGLLLLNQYGIGSGGIRSPYSDVPVASYYNGSPGPGNCREFGSTTPLKWSQLERIYGSHRDYARAVGTVLEKMESEGWATNADIRKMRSELTQ